MPGDHAQQRGLPAAVAADQADAVALEDGERRAVEQRQLAVRELRGGEGEQRQRFKPTPSSSTSKTSVAFGGITPPAPRSP